MKKKCCCCLMILFKYKKFTGDNHIHFITEIWKDSIEIKFQVICPCSYSGDDHIKIILWEIIILWNTKYFCCVIFVVKCKIHFTDQKGFILNTMMLSLSFPANIKYSHKTPILFLFIGVQTKFFLRGCWTRLDIINRRLGATSSSWVHCTFSQTLCCKNDFRNVSRILSLSCLVHLVEYARIHSFL